MNRHKLNVRMDLLRTAKTALDVSKPFDKNISNVFIDKALEEFSNNLKNETTLMKELSNFKSQMDLISNDPLKRIRWGEKILTIASRLGIQ